jgi:hypothetical protein
MAKQWRDTRAFRSPPGDNRSNPLIYGPPPCPGVAKMYVLGQLRFALLANAKRSSYHYESCDLHVTRPG